MSYLAIFKRVIPFFLTFAAGLLIASIFVPITAPNFNGFQNRRSNKMREYRQLRVEVEQLRAEKCRMKRELEELRRINAEQAPNWDTVPAFDLPVPPPAPPSVPRVVR